MSRRYAAALAVFAALADKARADTGQSDRPAASHAPSGAPSKPAAVGIEPVDKDQVVAILGQPVFGPKGEQIGRLTDVLVDSAGQPRAAVIDIGGFMGVGTRTIAVEWKSLRFEPWNGKAPIMLEMSLDQIKAMPAFKGLPANKAAPVVVPAPAPPQLSSQKPPAPPAPGKH